MKLEESFHTYLTGKRKENETLKDRIASTVSSCNVSIDTTLFADIVFAL